MLKKTLLLGFILLFFQLSFGQDVFRKTKTGINIGAGFRTIGLHAYGGNFSIERSVYHIKRFGYIGVDLTADVLYTASALNPDAVDDTDKLIPSGTFRTIYHAGFFRTKVLDVYTGVGLAISPTERSLFHPDAFLGFRYKFRQSNVGFFAEMGYYAANYKAGICFIW